MQLRNKVMLTEVYRCFDDFVTLKALPIPMGDRRDSMHNISVNYKLNVTLNKVFI